MSYVPPDPSKFGSLSQCDQYIQQKQEWKEEMENERRKYEIKLYDYETMDQSILKELEEIAFHIPLLQENIASLPESELKNEHIKRLNALTIRQAALSSRKNVHTPGDVKFVKNSIASTQMTIEKCIQEMETAKARREELVAKGVTK